MSLRFLEWVCFAAFGFGVGHWAGQGEWAMAAGVLLGSLGWFLLDKLRMRRLLQWVGSGAEGHPPRLNASWARVADQVKRLQKRLSRQADEHQRRLEAFLQAIQASPNGVLLLDEAYRIEWCNQTAADHLGIDPRRDVLQHVTNLVRDPAFSAYIGQAQFVSDVEIPGRGGSPGQPTCIAVRIHPYGHQRKLMLTRDVTAVQQAEAMRRDFVANVSHEIRTPLTVLSGFVETLQTLPLSEAERETYLDLMGQQAQRMHTLVSDLLTLSRLEGSPSPGRAEWTQVSDLLARGLSDARSLSAVLAQPGHGFAQEVSPVFEVAGSADELLSAVSNLFSNAVRYTPAAGQITCGAALEPDGSGRLWVSDTGPGIAPEHIPRLTERFYRVDRSRSRETGGTGLGLAIVKHVVQRHGGLLSISSELGKGSTFTLSFPADRIRCQPPAV